MEIRLIVAVVFAFAVCHVDAQVQSTSPLGAGNITLSGCNSTKLCFSYNSTCDPAGNSSCFFSSVQVTNQTLTVALSGSTNGFVALAINITNQNVTAVFICGNNNTTNTSFFVTAVNNGTSLNPTNMTTISNVQGLVNVNQSIVQCVFNVTSNLTISTNGANTTYNLTIANSTILGIYNGTTNGTDLGNFTTVYSSNTTVNLTMFANVQSNASTNATNSLNISRATCGVNKTCYSNASGCDPSGNSSCYFSSFQLNNQTLTVELSGQTTGYIALGVTVTNQSQITSYAFVCGLNTTNNSSFFQTAVINGTNLNTTNTFNASGSQSAVNMSQNLVQCVFNLTQSSFNGTFSSLNLSNLTIINTTLTIMNGTTSNGVQLGAFSTQFNQTFTLPPPTTPPPNPLNISRATCGVNKTCYSNASGCDPSVNSSCYFSSFQLNNQTLTVELSGQTTGYIALGLTITNQSQPTTVVFVCGLNTTNNGSFLQTATINNTNLSLLNVSTVIPKSLNVSQGFAQCVFNISANLTVTSSNGTNTFYNLTMANSTILSILNGTTTNGTTLGAFSTVYNSTTTVNLVNTTTNVTPTTTLSINRTNCGTKKLCIAGGTTPCDPSANPNCFFTSIQSNNNSYYFELTGRSSGYVALGLANQAANTMFVCGNRASNFFFQPYNYNSSGLSLANVTTVYSSQGVLNGNAIWCVFNISSNFSTTSARASDSSFNLTIANGTVGTGTSLGTPSAIIATVGTVNISNVTANPAIIDRSGANSLTHCTQVLAVLLGAMTLHFL